MVITLRNLVDNINININYNRKEICKRIKNEKKFIKTITKRRRRSK